MQIINPAIIQITSHLNKANENKWLHQHYALYLLAGLITRKMYRLRKKPGFAKDYVLKKLIQDAAGLYMHNIAEGFDS